jgi:hypothetical protein
MIAFEVKREGEKARPLQLAVLRKLERHGAICGVVESVEQVLAILGRSGVLDATSGPENANAGQESKVRRKRQ